MLNWLNLIGATLLFYLLLTLFDFSKHPHFDDGSVFAGCYEDYFHSCHNDFLWIVWMKAVLLFRIFARSSKEVLKKSMQCCRTEIVCTYMLQFHMQYFKH